MVLVFSASSNQSPQVRREVERAVHKQVNILPFRIEDLMPSWIRLRSRIRIKGRGREAVRRGAQIGNFVTIQKLWKYVQ